MKHVIKATIAIFSVLALVIACKKGDPVAPTNTADLTQLTALEYSLDSLNSLPASTAPASVSGTTLLTSSDIKDYIEYFKSGWDAVKKIREIADIFTRLFGHKWACITYSDGYCINDNVRNYRTIDDIIYTAIGRGGDCDWATYPVESSPQVCLRNKTDAQALIKKHGKIISIKWIDHPTKNCGK